MILVLSHAADVTADFVCSRLLKEGLSFARLDSDRLSQCARLSANGSRVWMDLDGRTLRPEDITGLLFRRPRPIRIEARDAAESAHASAEWAEAIEGFLACIPSERWINHPARAITASHKMEQLARASRIGFQIPETLVTQDETEARAFLTKNPRVVVKPLSGGFVERKSGDDTLIYTTRVLPEHVEHLALLMRCPTLFQVEIDKSYDVRVTAVDDRFSTVIMRKRDTEGHQVTDIRSDNWIGVEYRREELPESIAHPLSSMLSEYGLRFAAADFVVDHAGRWFFLEVNTGGQWAWLDQQAGTDIAGDLAWALTKLR